MPGNVQTVTYRLVLWPQNRHRLAMQPPRSALPDPSRLWLPMPLLLIFLGLPTVIELILIAADHGWGLPRWLRPAAYQYGAFWAGLLDNWRPNYEAQPWLMFVTYSFLHAGLWHLVGNMVALVYLMQLNADQLRSWSFLVLYIASAMGGALAFALLRGVLSPMVGASGALFGLLGAWRLCAWKRCVTTTLRWRMALRDCFYVIVLNAVMWVVERGALAWEAHIGGFATGVVVMALLLAYRKWRDTSQGG